MKDDIFIACRLAPDLKRRFDSACKYKGWNKQETMDRIISQFVRSVEVERAAAEEAEDAGLKKAR